MKVWKAQLVLFCGIDDKFKTSFNFELQEEEYRVNEKFNEWIYSENWICRRIPMDMTIENGSSLRIIQGFNYELNCEELILLEKDMRELMKKQLEYEKEIYLKQLEEKLKSI